MSELVAITKEIDHARDQMIQEANYHKEASLQKAVGTWGELFVAQKAFSSVLNGSLEHSVSQWETIADPPPKPVVSWEKFVPPSLNLNTQGETSSTSETVDLSDVSMPQEADTSWEVEVTFTYFVSQVK
jgi:hypothetical protein